MSAEVNDPFIDHPSAPEPGTTKTRRVPTLGLALLPIAAMVVFLAVGYIWLGLAAEPLIVAATFVAGFVAIYLGWSFDEIMAAISEKLAKVMPAFLILISVGFLIGAWMIGGTIPMIIYYGLEIISPEWLALTALLVTSIVSLATGTSWGSAGTIGVAFMGVAIGLDANLALVAGAVVAGAYFGDKMSPLSDTTNLAALTTGVNLYTHIGNMIWTTGPAYLLSIVVFATAGRSAAGAVGNLESVSLINGFLDQAFNWNVLLLLPLLMVLVGSMMRKPTVPVMILASVVALINAVIFQGQTFANAVQATLSGFDLSMLEAIGLDASGAPAEVSRLLERGGMSSMMGTLLIAFCALSFAGVVARTGALDLIVEKLMNVAKSTSSLILSTIAICLVTIATTCNGQVSIVMPGEMLREAYIKRGLHPKVLSRTLEDSVTVTETLIPWTAAGAYMAGTLGVATLDYAPWAVLNWAGMIFAAIWAFTGLGIKRITPAEQDMFLNNPQAAINA